MGWLLTIWMALPLADSDVEVEMWFSRKSYCTFAQAKFLENPIKHTTIDGRTAMARITDSRCRKLRDDESSFIPGHMRD